MAGLSQDVVTSCNEATASRTLGQLYTDESTGYTYRYVQFKDAVTYAAGQGIITDISPIQLHAEAARNAIDDAGITRDDIDGVACVGDIGAENRFNYSAVGDSVNTTARIESMCKDFGFDILVSGATAERLKDFAILEAGSRSLKGKSQKTDIYLLVGDEALARTPEFESLKAAHGGNVDPPVSGR